MAWGPDARRLTIELYKDGTSEKEIVVEVRKSIQCDDKSVRRCISGLDLIQAGAIGREGELEDALLSPHFPDQPHGCVVIR